MGPLGELGALFNPGMRHEIEERQAKANRREEEGNARDGDLRIDLASGVAVISLSNGGDHPAAPAEPRRSKSTETGTADAPLSPADAPSEQSDVGSPGPDHDTGTEASAGNPDEADDAEDTQPAAEPASADSARRAAARGTKPLTAAQARRLATAARRSASGDQPARTATPRPANAQLPSSKASRAAR